MDATEYAGNQKWLRAPDLKGKRVTVRVSEWSTATFKDRFGQDKKQLVLHFHNTGKLLGLNVTNTRTMIGLYGPDTDGWIGKAIALYPTTTDYEGKQTDCIRIEAQAPIKQIEAEQARPIAHGSQAAPEYPRRITATNGGSMQAPLPQHVSHQVGRATISTTQAGQPDRDELEDSEIPF